MSDKHIPRKRFGQNFLHDQGIIQKIVKSIAPKENDNIVEIGPGQGAITEPLIEKLNHLNVVELDRDLIPLLQDKFAGQSLDIHESDALKFDFRKLMQEAPLRIVGNLPYNISTPLLFHLLSYHTQVKDMHFMLQLEVVDRLAAAPGSKAYGRLSIITQYYCQVDKLFNVPQGAFNPPPKVMSAIVRLVPRELDTKVTDESLFQTVVKTAFSQRRKTLRNNLKQLLAADQLDQLTQDLSLRPEQLSLEDYIHLSNEIVTLPSKND